MGKLFRPVFFLMTIIALSFLTACVEKPKEGEVNNNQYQTKKDANARKRAQELTNKNINPKLANQVKAKDLKRVAGLGANARYNVPVNDQVPFLGEKDALITIVEYSDFECPFCSRVEPTLAKLLDEYKGKIKLVWKNNPLGFHKNALPAAEAGYTIFKLKGNEAFWKAHDTFYKNSKNLTPEFLAETAKSLGVDMAQYKEAIEKGTYRRFVLQEQSESNRLGARGTPAFFINGKFLSGAQPYDNFKKIIDEELAFAEQTLKSSGVAKDQLYNEIVKNGLTKAPTPERQAPQQQQRPGSPDPAKAYFNDIDGFPFMGEKDAL
ncbi:thioredoxin domain-containing protein, partial [bacterium]|nr:thioredoxin domain-containing protein [bacterium]